MAAQIKLDPEQMLPLTPAVFHVLLALADEERHGYAIMTHVAETTEGQIKMGPGTLYGTIKRLLDAKLIEESDERPDPQLDDERRRYYRLTNFGSRVLQAEALRYAKLVKVARTSGVLPCLSCLPKGVSEKVEQTCRFAWNRGSDSPPFWKRLLAGTLNAGASYV